MIIDLDETDVFEWQVYIAERQLSRQPELRIPNAFDGECQIQIQDETDLRHKWDESQHPREPAGTGEGGQFVGEGEGEGGEEGKPLSSQSVAERARKLEQMETSLRNSPITRDDPISTHSSSEVRLVETADGTKGVFKPASGEKFDISASIPNNMAYKREAAAWGVAKVVGMDDMVPPSVVRRIDGQVGSVHKFMQGEVAQGVLIDEKYGDSEDCDRAAAFDFVMGNTDRHDGNWLVDKGKLKLIDNGLSLPVKEWVTKPSHQRTFGEHRVNVELRHILNLGLMSNAISRSAGDPSSRISPSIKKQWEGKWPKIEGTLKSSGIEQEAITLAKERYDKFLATEKFEELKV